jgi:tRNA G18 (ribose-2'-O)-methylase SpoU
VITKIDDPLDPRVEPYLDIRERDLRGRGARFVIEGEVVLRVALSRGLYPVESILLATNRVGPLRDALAACPAALPVYVVAPSVLERIAGFPLHRGVLALGRCDGGGAGSWEVLLPKPPARALVLVLSGIANHDNMGGLFRNAAAFGVSLVILDETSCDPLYRKAIRVSAGAALTVPFGRAGSITSVVRELETSGVEVLATSPRGGREVAEIVPGPRIAVVFGAEGQGLPAELLSPTRTIRIDMAPGIDSLNVATASGIVLHRLRMPQADFAASPARDRRGGSRQP